MRVTGTVTLPMSHVLIPSLIRRQVTTPCVSVLLSAFAYSNLTFLTVGRDGIGKTDIVDVVVAVVVDVVRLIV